MKWSSRPVGTDLHTDLMRNLKDLGASGQGWAKDALSPDRSAGYVYFSAAGFTDAFRSRVSGDSRVRLFELADLYER